MIVSKQHKKQPLIFNQNLFDFCSCLLIAIIYTLKLCNIYLTGKLGYWLCMIALNENILWCSATGSLINLMTITIERYLKVVHATWSRKVLRKWMEISAGAFARISSTAYNMAVGFEGTTRKRSSTFLGQKCIPEFASPGKISRGSPCIDRLCNLDCVLCSDEVVVAVNLLL